MSRSNRDEDLDLYQIIHRDLVEQENHEREQEWEVYEFELEEHDRKEEEWFERRSIIDEECGYALSLLPKDDEERRNSVKGLYDELMAQWEKVDPEPKLPEGPLQVRAIPAMYKQEEQDAPDNINPIPTLPENATILDVIKFRRANMSSRHSDLMGLIWQCNELFNPHRMVNAIDWYGKSISEHEKMAIRALAGHLESVVEEVRFVVSAMNDITEQKRRK